MTIEVTNYRVLKLT